MTSDKQQPAAPPERHSGDCLNRAFMAGLRYCGLPAGSIPVMTESDHLKTVAESYGLTFLWKGAKIQAGNAPVLMVYRDDSDSTDGEYHAVFASDQAPFTRWPVHSAVVGWDELAARVHPVDDARVAIREIRALIEGQRDKWLARLTSSGDLTFKSHYQTRADAATEILSLLPQLSSSEPHRCPHFKPKGEDSGGAYNAGIIIDVTNELIYPEDRDRLHAKPTSWYSLLIKQLIQRIANLRVMLAEARTVSSSERRCGAYDLYSTCPYCGGREINETLIGLRHYRCRKQADTAASVGQCDMCGHSNVDREGTCREQVSPPNYRNITYCGHRCVFPATTGATTEYEEAKASADHENRVTAFDDWMGREDYGDREQLWRAFQAGVKFVKGAGAATGAGEQRDEGWITCWVDDRRAHILFDTAEQARQWVARFAASPVPVAEGEPLRAKCVNCAESITRYGDDQWEHEYPYRPECLIATPIPTAAPVVETRIPSDFITATGELKDWNESTVTTGKAAGEIVCEWIAGLNYGRLPPGQISRLTELIAKRLPRTEATQPNAPQVVKQVVYVSQHPLHLRCNTCGLEQTISLQCPREDGQLVVDNEVRQGEIKLGVDRF